MTLPPTLVFRKGCPSCPQLRLHKGKFRPGSTPKTVEYRLRLGSSRSNRNQQCCKYDRRRKL